MGRREQVIPMKRGRNAPAFAVLERKMEKSMLELGINSSMVIQIMIMIEDEFNIIFPDDIITPELFLSPMTLYDGLLKIVDDEHE